MDEFIQPGQTNNQQPVVSSRPPQPKTRILGSYQLPLLALYLVVLFLGIFLAYSSEHSSLVSAQKDLADARSQLAAISPSQSESINKNEYQAVFLQNDQVYFGKISFFNKEYMKLTDIYYLQNGQTGLQAAQTIGNPSSSVSLVKLGCELHAPEDSMVIQNSHVYFWENLRNDGQVVKAIDTYKTNNPAGLNCK